MSRLPVPLGPLGGALALLVATATLIAELATGPSVATTASLILGGGAGALALWHYERPGALVVADGLLAAAVVAALFGFGALFVLPLLVLLVATLDVPAEQPEPRHLAPSALATSFVAGPVRQSRLAVRHVREAVSDTPVIPPESEPREEPLRRTA
jgi:hypothetical protein